MLVNSHQSFTATSFNFITLLLALNTNSVKKAKSEKTKQNKKSDTTKNHKQNTIQEDKQDFQYYHPDGKKNHLNTIPLIIATVCTWSECWKLVYEN